MALIDFDVEEYLHEASVEALTEELARRKSKAGGIDQDLGGVRDALLRGNPNEALCTLDCILFPKWKSPAECRAEYDKAMGRVAA